MLGEQILVKGTRLLLLLFSNIDLFLFFEQWLPPCFEAFIIIIFV